MTTGTILASRHTRRARARAGIFWVARVCRTARAHQLVLGEFCGRRWSALDSDAVQLAKRICARNVEPTVRKGGPPPWHIRGEGVASIVILSGAAPSPRLFAILFANGDSATRSRPPFAFAVARPDAPALARRAAMRKERKCLQCSPPALSNMPSPHESWRSPALARIMGGAQCRPVWGARFEAQVEGRFK
jgi:hypothetical protein